MTHSCPHPLTNPTPPHPPPHPTPAPCGVQVKAPSAFRQSPAPSPWRWHPGTTPSPPPPPYNLSLQRLPREGAIASKLEGRGRISMHFGKSVVPRVGRPSTGLAFLLIYTNPSPSSASRTTIQAQILQSLPAADHALHKDLGVEAGGVTLGRTPCWQAFSVWLGTSRECKAHRREQTLPYPSPAGLAAETHRSQRLL